MDLSTITNNILQNFKKEIEKEENILLIKKDLLRPIIKYTLDEIYPYFFKCIIGIISVLLFLIILIFLNLKIILKV
tara:strand:+ start:128 stop:355 length:228 start_codon:yes stop_codon:yes gene_type:complete